jgi:ribosomal-protein-alanine N-acetyltransferase
MSNIYFLNDDRIGLRPLSKADVLGNYGSWLNDSDITTFNSHGRFPMTPDMLNDYVENSYSKNSIVLAIIFKETEEHIGNISLQNINWIDRNAEIAFLLGEKKYWGKGIMLDAGALLIKHAFDSLNLHRVYCGTSSLNIGMQKLAKKLGMIQEGHRKDALFKNGEFLDIIEFGVINK